MWQRFTERSRRVVFYAQEEAGRLGENYVSTEHLLLGVLRAQDSVAVRILDQLGVSVAQVRTEVERQAVHGKSPATGEMQLTPRAKRVVDLAYEEARQLGNDYIGTEHLLLGLIREEAGLAGRVLIQLGASLEKTRAAVIRLQNNDPLAAGAQSTTLSPDQRNQLLRRLGELALLIDPSLKDVSGSAFRKALLGEDPPSVL